MSRSTRKHAANDDSESGSDDAFAPSAAALARMNRAVVATPSHTAHVPLGGVSSLTTRSSAYAQAASVGTPFGDAAAAAISGAGQPAAASSVGAAAAATPAAAAAGAASAGDTSKVCVECAMRKANQQCSNTCCRSCCFALMSRSGVTCAEHTKARAMLERDSRQAVEAPEQFLSSTVSSAMSNVAAVVARLNGPRLDALAPYTSALGDALTSGQPVIDAEALTAAARTSILSPATGQPVALHDGNLWAHLYTNDRSNLAAYMQLAFERARAWNVAPDHALALPPREPVSELARDALNAARPVDVVRGRAAQRLADNEALLGTLFGLAPTPPVPLATASGDTGAQWKRIEAQAQALNSESLEAVVHESETAAQLYAEAIQRISECTSEADVKLCRDKMKREWQAAFDDTSLKRRRTLSQLGQPAATRRTVNI